MSFDPVSYLMGKAAGGGGGGSGIPLLTRAAWNTLSTAQKQAYGLVAVQDANSGFDRGELYNGADYSETLLIYSSAANILTEIAPDDYTIGGSTWGDWGIIGPEYVTKDASGFVSLPTNAQAYYDLSVQNLDITIYAVIRPITTTHAVYYFGVPYALSSGNGVGWVSLRGHMGATTFDYDTETNVSAGNTWFALATSISKTNSVAKFFMNGESVSQLSLNNVGSQVLLSGGPGNTDRNADIDVYYAAVVSGTESNQTILGNLQNIMAHYDDLFGA